MNYYITTKLHKSRYPNANDTVKIKHGIRLFNSGVYFGLGMCSIVCAPLCCLFIYSMFVTEEASFLSLLLSVLAAIVTGVIAVFTTWRLFQFKYKFDPKTPLHYIEGVYNIEYSGRYTRFTCIGSEYVQLSSRQKRKMKLDHTYIILAYHPYVNQTSAELTERSPWIVLEIEEVS